MADGRWRMSDGAEKAEAGSLKSHVRGRGSHRSPPQRSAPTDQHFPRRFPPGPRCGQGEMGVFSGFRAPVNAMKTQ